MQGAFLRWLDATTGWSLVRQLAWVDRRLTVTLVAAAAATGALTPALALATGAVVAAVEARAAVGPALIALGLAFALQRLTDPLHDQVGAALARRVDEALARRMMAVMSAPPGLAHVEDPSVGNLLARAQGGLTGVTVGGAAPSVAGVWIPRVQGVLSLAIVAAWRWWAAAALVAAYAVTFVVSRAHWRSVTLVMYGRTGQLRRAYYLRRLALTAAAAKETRVFGLASWLVDRYRGEWFGVMRDVWAKRREGWGAALAVFLLAAAIEVTVMVALGRAALAGEVGAGTMIATAVAVLGAGALGVFNEPHWYLVEAHAALDQLRELDQVGERPGALAGGTTAADALPRHSIRFERVAFNYPGHERPVFEALDLEIEAGRSLAIVGDNGAGKTTFVKLLARLYDPQGGRISVDGIDLRQIEPRTWHRRVAAIFQDFTQFDLTAYDNVSFGALGRRHDRAAVALAAELAGASRIVERLPGGWETPLTREVSGGAQLSGGEWQRLALARALFAVQAGAGVLVLDEPTASLDVRGEAEVYERFLELTRGTTTIIISHRFSTVRRADRIVVLEHGRVVEDGTHESLVRAGGRYAAMYALQASRFRGEAGGHETGSGEAGDDYA